MPRVISKTKSARGREYTCSTCGQKIETGDTYLSWSFRYGGTYRIHASHGYPRQSQLTQSLMGEVYASIESVEDIIGDDTWTLEDAENAVEELKGVCDEIIQQYEDAAEPFGGQGPSMEKAEELTSYRDELDSLDLDEWKEAEEHEQTGEPAKCSECDGEGTVLCHICDGKGEVTSGILIPIVLVVDGKKIEEHEEEMVNCDVCSGEGRVECPECKGTGESDEEPDTSWRDDAKSHVEEIIGGAP